MTPEKTDKIILIMGGLTFGLIILAWAAYLYVSERRQDRFEHKMLEELRMQTAVMGKDRT